MRRVLLVAIVFGAAAVGYMTGYMDGYRDGLAGVVVPWSGGSL
jgi:hypothetical protein